MGRFLFKNAGKVFPKRWALRSSNRIDTVFLGVLKLTCVLNFSQTGQNTTEGRSNFGLDQHLNNESVECAHIIFTSE